MPQVSKSVNLYGQWRSQVSPRLVALPPRSHQLRLLLDYQVTKHDLILFQVAPPWPRLVIHVAVLILLLRLPHHERSLQIRTVHLKQRARDLMIQD